MEVATSIFESETIKEVVRVYEELVRFHQSPPSIELIRLHYQAAVDSRIINLQASLYGDDFYDGSPNKKITHLPESVMHDIESYIDITLTIKYEQIQGILNCYSLVYAIDCELYNSPLQEVW